jgi:FkbM family methyltransferase
MANEYKLNNGYIFIDPVGFEKREMDLEYLYEYWKAESNWIVVDLGSCYGAFALTYSPLVDKIYAVEPTPETCEILKSNLDRNGVTNVIICPYAITDKNKVAVMNRCKGGQCNTFYTYDHGGSQDFEKINTFEVSCMTMDKFCEENNITRIDLLKCDIEGSEGNMLRGMTKVLPKRIAIAHYHHNTTSKAETSDELRVMLEAKGYLYIKSNWHTAFYKLKE